MAMTSLYEVLRSVLILLSATVLVGSAWGLTGHVSADMKKMRLHRFIALLLALQTSLFSLFVLYSRALSQMYLMLGIGASLILALLTVLAILRRMRGDKKHVSGEYTLD